MLVDSLETSAGFSAPEQSFHADRGSCAKLRLSELGPGQAGAVLSLGGAESLCQRFRALGFRIGQPVSVIRRAAFFGPLHVRIGSTDVILRRREAALIELRTA